MQVGGRSGRADLPGEVLIQTEYPTHPLYQALIDHDYSRFAQSQLDDRKTAGFPPFAFQAMLRAESPAMGESVGFLT
jgi:primosomal protein N' (replication factor Y)